MNMEWFDKELELAASENVSHLENRPFLLHPQDPNGQAVILIHGFSSSPREMRKLGEFLRDHQFIVYGVRLPGHGTSPADLAGRQVEEWRLAIRRAYDALAGDGLRISAAGLSTGALLTLDLALGRTLDKIILLSPFLKLRHWLADYVGFLSPLLRYQKKDIPLSEQPFYYQKRPLKGIVQINRLRWSLKKKLHLIKNPALVLASTGDATIAPGTAETLYRKLGSRNKDFHLYGEEVPHVLTGNGNPKQTDVLQRCLVFLQGERAE